jgi:hypothetical protein
MARDDSGRRDPEEELRVAQAEVARLTEENETLRDVVRVLIEEITPEGFSRARKRLDRIDAGEEAGDETGE